MTTFIYFIIAMVILYIVKLLISGFDITELISYLIMAVLLVSHVYLSTRKKAILGIVIPIFFVISFYPVYKLINPVGATLVVLIGSYVITLGCFFGVWYRARKNKDDFS